MDFCNEIGEHPLEKFTASRCELLITYLRDYTDISSQEALKVISAIRSYHLDNGIEYDLIKKNHPGIGRLIKEFEIARPPKEIKTRPLPRELLKRIHKKVNWDNIEEVKEYALLVNAYEGGMRVSEYMGDNEGNATEKTIFNENMIHGGGNYVDEIKIATIKFRKTKTDRIGGKEKVAMKCMCNGYNSAPCAIHSGLKWIQMRKEQYPKKCRRKSAPYFCRKDGKALSYNEVNSIVKKWCKKIGLKNWKQYATHSLRAGKTIDLVMSGLSYLFIKKWGRWKSMCYEDHYAKLEVEDVAHVIGMTINEFDQMIFDKIRQFPKVQGVRR